MKFKKIVALALFLVGSFAFCETNKKEEEKQELGFVENIKSFKSHRFLEFRGAFPYPVLTTHGSVQSLVVGFGDTFGETFSFGTDFDNTSPSIATDLNLTVFPPFSDYSLGFMSGVSLDKWNHKKKDNSDETLWMNYYYVGFHADYAHWVLLDIGTRLSVYGGDGPEENERIDRAVDGLKGILGDRIYSLNDDNLEHVVGTILKSSGKTFFLFVVDCNSAHFVRMKHKNQKNRCLFVDFNVYNVVCVWILCFCGFVKF